MTSAVHVYDKLGPTVMLWVPFVQRQSAVDV